MKAWLILGAIVATLYLLLVVAVHGGQRSLLYFPSHDNVPTRLTPWIVDGQLIGYTSVDRSLARESKPSDRADGSLARESKDSDPARVWLMLHGNAGQAAHRDYILRCLAPGDVVFILEYPGYGQRPGKPSKPAFDAAASSAYRALRARYPVAPVGIIGESIGSGPACTLAAEPRPPDRIVLITPFDTLVKVAKRKFPFLPIRLLLKDRWDNIAALRGYKGQVTIYGALHDEVIPIDHARALASAIGVSVIEMPSGHNTWSQTGVVRLGP